MSLKFKERISSGTSIFSGFLSFLGGYQVCHNICLAIIAALSIIGIVITGMPLLFLTKVAVPFWIAAVLLLIITLVLYFKKKCISKTLIIFNTGILIAGTPFQQAQEYSVLLWSIGGVLVIISIISYTKSKVL